MALVVSSLMGKLTDSNLQQWATELYAGMKKGASADTLTLAPDRKEQRLLVELVTLLEILLPLTSSQPRRGYLSQSKSLLIGSTIAESEVSYYLTE